MPDTFRTSEVKIQSGEARWAIAEVYPGEPPPTPPPPPPPPIQPTGILFQVSPSTYAGYGAAYIEEVQQVVFNGDRLPAPTGATSITLIPAPAFNYGFVKWEAYKGTSLLLQSTQPKITIPLDAGITTVILAIDALPSPPSTPTGLPGVTASTYISAPFTQPTKFTETFTTLYNLLEAKVQHFKETFVTRYALGLGFTPTYQYQNVRVGEEEWTLLYASPTQSGHPALNVLGGFMLRHFLVENNTAFFVLISEDYPYYLRFASLNLETGEWFVHGEWSLSVPPREAGKYPEFGSVATGHGGFVFATTTDAYYFNIATGEPLRIPLLSSFFNIPPEQWGARCVLVVPEGFLFLPHCILWDLDTFWDFPTNINVSQNDRVLPVYFEGVAAIAVRTGEYGNNPSNSIKDFYVWGGMEKGLVKGKVGVTQALQQAGITTPYPFYRRGSLLKGKHYAINAYLPLDEAAFVRYTLEKDQNNPGDMTKWTLTLDHVQFALPLPFNPPQALWKPPGWGEIWGFSTATNTSYLYFPRVWNRIYRLDPETWEVALAHSIPYLDFSGNMSTKFMGDEEGQILLWFNWQDGKMYACHMLSGARIQVWAQTVAITPPPAPDILFPEQGMQVPRQFEVILQPHAHSKPQEFAITFIVDTGAGGQHFAFHSTIHRQHFFISNDSGLTWQQMTGAIMVTEQNEQNIRVKFNLPIYLPQSSIVTVRAQAIAVD